MAQNKLVSYVGYTNNLIKRLSLHNTILIKELNSLEAYKWLLIYTKKFKSKA